MPSLTIFCEGKRYTKVEFYGPLTFGRNRENDVVLKGEEVSRFHASIYQNTKDEYILNDLSSRNHVVVNGEFVQQYNLHHGTSFNIGPYSLAFEEVLKEEKRPFVKLTRKIAHPKKSQVDSKKTVLFLQNEEQERTLPLKRMELLLSLSNELVSTLDYNEFFEKALESSLLALQGKRGFVAEVNKEGQLVYSALSGFGSSGEKLKVSKGLIDLVIEEGQPVLTANAVQDPVLSEFDTVLMYKLKSVMCVPIRHSGKILGCIYLDDPDKEDNFSEEDLNFFSVVANQIGIGLNNAKVHRSVNEQVTSLKNRLQAKERVVATSKTMKDVDQLVKKVAPTNFTVLVLGEPGVGKELVSRSVHNYSGRKGRLIALNCAALPETLLESELFGYEKGAFYGAAKQKPGMFELADNGTIFLDEIGDMPLPLQVKVLRVLEGKQVMRLGGERYVSFNTRVVAATNQNLEKMVVEQKFRQDLYDRLNVVEIKVPPLRERSADILVLAHFLLSKISEENALPLPILSNKAKDAILAYDWPGNIRELKNSLSRATIAGDGKIIKPDDLPESVRSGVGILSPRGLTLDEVEEQHIKKILKLTKGDKQKAAKMLGIARDTIYKKIYKYGI